MTNIKFFVILPLVVISEIAMELTIFEIISDRVIGRTTYILCLAVDMFSLCALCVCLSLVVSLLVVSLSFCRLSVFLTHTRTPLNTQTRTHVLCLSSFTRVSCFVTTVSFFFTPSRDEKTHGP